MLRTWRLESLALLSLWAGALALLVGAARVPYRPVAVAVTAPDATPAVAAPTRRPPVARPPARDSARPAEEAESADAPAEVSVEPIELEGLEIHGFGSSGEDGSSDDFVADEYDAEGYGYSDDNAWLRPSHYRWTHRSQIPQLRVSPGMSSLFSGAAAPTGALADPCGVLPGACSAPSAGGAYAPPIAPVAARSTALVAREATATRAGDGWLLANAGFSLEVNALCLLTARRAGDDRVWAAAFAPPAVVSCQVRETAVPWDDREGAALELTWNSPAGSMRAVVALADDGDAPEASVSRTDTAGATQLHNLGSIALSWTVAGRSVTVAPGGAVRVRRSARA